MFWVLISIGTLVTVGILLHTLVKLKKYTIMDKIRIAAVIGTLSVIVILATISIYSDMITKFGNIEYEAPQEIKSIEVGGVEIEVIPVSKTKYEQENSETEYYYIYYETVNTKEQPNAIGGYKAKKLISKNVTIKVDESYRASPRLVTYKRKPIINFWTCVVISEKMEYVFYVTEDMLCGRLE